MKFSRKAIVAVNLREDMSEVLKSIRGLEFLNHSEIHLVYVFPIITYGLGFGEITLSYPIEDDRKVLEQSTLATLHNVSKKIFVPGFQGKVVLRCLFGEDPKRKFSKYVTEEKADLVIVAAREKRGIFESSFTKYVNEHTDANVIILKHKA